MKQLIQNVDSQLKSKTLELGDEAEEERFVDDDVAAVQKNLEDTSERYLPLAREPRYARAQHTPLWELFALASHVHPFVSHGAVRLLSAETFEDAGENPFQEFSTGELLEQFAYASSKPRTKKGEQAAARLPYNSDKFMRRKRIAPHERFFHQYFRDSTVREQQKRKAARRKQREEDVDEDGEAADGGVEEDEFFDDHIREQMPKGDFDVDPDMDDDSDDPDLDDFDEDAEEDADGGDDGGGNSDSEAMGRDSDANDTDGEDEADSGGDGDSDDKSEAEAHGGEGRKGKRKALKAMPRKEQAKEIKKMKKKHSGSLFASAEDFETFLDDFED